MFILLLSIPSMLFWTILYGTLRKIYKQQTPEFANRLVTFCHGVIVCSYGSTQCFVNGWAFYNYNVPTSMGQAAVMLLSLGYFMFDLIWCLYYQTETKLMIAHHIYSCFAMSRMLIKGHSANQATCALGMMEVTNPLLQLRWFVRTLGYQKTALFKFVEWSFVTIFIGMRLILGSVIGFEVVTGEQDWEFKLLAVLIYLVSWAFMINMYMYMRKKYHDKRTALDVTDTDTVTSDTSRDR